MKNNLVKQTVLTLVGKAAELELKKVNSKWPVCVGLLLQPKRPLNTVEVLSKKNNK